MQKRKGFSLDNKLVLVAFVFIAILLFIFLYSVFLNNPSWKMQTSHLSGNVVASGGLLSGNLKVLLRDGELLPANSKIVLEQNGQSQEISLDQVLGSNANGSYYIEEGNIAGSGAGYGFEGSQTVYPDVNFTLAVSQNNQDQSQSGSETQTATDNSSSQTSSSQTTSDNSSGQTSSPPTSDNSVSQTTQSSSSDNSGLDSGLQTPAENPQTNVQSSDTTSSSPLTGAVVLGSETEVDGTVNEKAPFEYNLNGEQVSLVPGSVFVDGQQVSDSVVSLDTQSDKVVVTTSYSKTEKGFGAGFLGAEHEIKIPLDKLNFAVSSGNLTVSLVYGSIVLSEATDSVAGNANLVMNETVGGDNQTLTGNQTLTNGTVEQKGNLTIETKKYRIVINRPVKWQKKITGNLSDASVVLPKEAENISVATGSEIQQAEQLAQDTANVLAENKTALLESANLNSDNSSIITGNVALKIELRKPGIISEFLSWFSNLFVSGVKLNESAGSVTGNVVESVDNAITNDSGKVVDVSSVVPDNSTEALVQYETPGPTSEEVNITRPCQLQSSDCSTIVGKQVTISAPEELNYTDVLAYTELDNSVPLADKGKIKIYHDVNGTRESVDFSAYDLDNDGKIDYVEWNVPHFSEQVYEIIYVAKAVKLDSNQVFIEDVYDYVKALDGNYTTIQSGDSVRVTFDQVLDSTKDITLYAKSTDTNVPGKIEVYPVYADANGNQVEGNGVIGVSDGVNPNFDSISQSGKYRILLQNLQEPTDTFDLRSVGEVDYDYIVDPTGSISECGSITSSGTYTLNQSLYLVTDTGGASCLNITASNVVLDGNGFMIDGFGGYQPVNGIVASGVSNITVENFSDLTGFNGDSAYQWGLGIYFDNVENSFIRNVDATTGAGTGGEIGLYGSSHNVISNVIVTGGQFGVYLNSSSNNTLDNVNVVSAYNGIGISGSNNNNLTNIVATSNRNGIYFSSGSNNILTNLALDSNGYGINLDYSNGNSFSGETSGSGTNIVCESSDSNINSGLAFETQSGCDSWIGPHTLSGCGTINVPGTYTTLANSLSGISGTCFNITASNVILDGGNNSIIGDGTGNGIDAEGVDNITIENFSQISGFDKGIYFSGVTNSFVNNVTTNQGYSVTGGTAADGNYVLDGTYNDRPVYTNWIYYIWFSGGWGVISNSIGGWTGPLWYINDGTNPFGSYTPWSGEASGNPVFNNVSGQDQYGIYLDSSSGNSFSGHLAGSILFDAACTNSDSNIDGGLTFGNESGCDSWLSLPAIQEVTPITAYSNNPTPTVTLKSDKDGSIVGCSGDCDGKCSSYVGNGITANNPFSVVFDSLIDNTYSNCQLIVNDTLGNQGSITLSPFSINTRIQMGNVVPSAQYTNNSNPTLAVYWDGGGQDGSIVGCGWDCNGMCNSYIGQPISSITLFDSNRYNSEGTGALHDGTYSDCEVTINDTYGNQRTTTAWPVFTILTATPLATNIWVNWIMDQQVGGESYTSWTGGQEIWSNGTFITLLSSELPQVCQKSWQDDYQCNAMVTFDSFSSYSMINEQGRNYNPGSGPGFSLDLSSAISQDTSHSVQVCLTDPAGNVGCSAPFTLHYVSTVSPAIQEVTPITAYSNNPTPTVTLKSDKDGSIVGCSGDCDGKCSSYVGNRVTANTPFNMVFDSLSDNTYSNCVVNVSDSVGNQGSVTLSPFTIYTTPPSTTNIWVSGMNSGQLVGGGSTSWTGGQEIWSNGTFITLKGAELSQDCQDGSHPCNATIILGGGDYGSYAMTYNGGPGFNLDFSSGAIASYITPDSSNNVQVCLDDPEGNRGCSSSFTLHYQVTPPSVSINYPSESGSVSYTGFTSSFSYNYGDSITCLYSWNGSSYTAFSSCGATDGLYPRDGDGAKTLYVKGVDAAGNANIASVNFTYSNVVSPPVVREVTPIAMYTNNPTPTVTLQSNKTGSIAGCTNNCNGKCNSYIGSAISANTPFSITFSNLADSTYSDCEVFVNDSSGNQGSVTLSPFTIDTVSPMISIFSPVNNSISLNIHLSVNYSVSDLSSGVGSCWFSNDSMSLNTTLTGCVNITSVVWSQGVHNVRVYVNDSAGNLNSSSVRFSIDSAAPLVSLVYPLNTSYNTNVLALNYTYSETNPDKCWYSTNNGVTNSSSVNMGINFTGISSSEGSNRWTVYCNDSVGNLNSSSVTFFKDTVAPSLIINSPLNQTYNLTATLFNVTSADSNGVSSCRYSLDSGASVVIANSGSSWSATNSVAQGSHNVTFYCNDTYNNVNSASRIFFTDSVAPVVTFAGGSVSNNGVYNTTTWTGAYGNCGDGGSGCTGICTVWNANTNLTLGNCEAWTPSSGQYRIFLRESDFAGNVGQSSTVNFTYYTVAPSVSITYPVDGQSYDSVSVVNYSAVAGDVSLDKCWYSLNSVNSTPVSCGSSFTNMTTVKGNNTLVVYANDTNGIGGSVSLTFAIVPTINLALASAPNANDVAVNDSLFVIASLNVSNFANVTYSLYNSANGVVNRTTFNSQIGWINWTSLPSGLYRYQVNVSDSLGDKNFTALRNVTLLGSCLDSNCVQNGNCNIVRSCYLNSGMCGGVCQFSNFTSNSTIYSLYDANGNGNNLIINLSGSDVFRTGSSIVFSGDNGSDIGSGSRGGSAGVLNISVPNLFNTTNAKFVGIGGTNTPGLVGAIPGGNGGMINIMARGWIRKFDDDFYDFPTPPSNAPVLYAGNGFKFGDGGAITYYKDISCVPKVKERDVDINGDGVVDIGDYYLIAENYNNISTELGFNQTYDISCDGKLNVVEISREGYQYSRGS